MVLPPPRSLHLPVLLPAFLLFALGASIRAAPFEAGELAPAPRRELSALPALAEAPVRRAAGLSVDSSSRAAVARFYYEEYFPLFGLPANWTGQITGCVAGSTSFAYEYATVSLINCFRALAGLPGDIITSNTLDFKCQQAALMMISAGALSHEPGTDWPCYTPDGAEAARNSNIALGYHGPDAIEAYMVDRGTGNAAVGHRRWILYPPLRVVGTGSVSAQQNFFRGSNALWVFGPVGARPSQPESIARPPPGNVPAPIIWPRWSFSRAGADFTSATVTVSRAGQPVALAVVDRASNYGDPAIVWEPQGINAGAASAGDIPCTVIVDGVIVGGSPRRYEYTVIIFDPALDLTGAGGWLIYH